MANYTIFLASFSSPLQWCHLFLYLNNLKNCDVSQYKGFDRENIEIGQKLVEDVIFSPGNIDFRISRSILHKKKFIIQTLPKKGTEFDLPTVTIPLKSDFEFLVQIEERSEEHFHKVLSE